MHVSEFDGVVFVEGSPKNAKIIEHIEAKIHGIFSQSHLKNLNDVKHKLAQKVKLKKGNCLINFKYGQKSSFWTTLIGVDNVNWYGEGDVAFLSGEALSYLKES